MKPTSLKFSATVNTIEGSNPAILNPCVEVPQEIVDKLQAQAGKEKGPVQVKCELKKTWYPANVVKYKGTWRLYLHGIMRRETGINVGDTISVVLQYDPAPRMPPVPKAFRAALAANKDAAAVWRMQPRSRRKEILNYMNGLKTEESLSRNIKKVIDQFIAKKKS